MTSVLQTTTQFASPDLITDIVYGGRDPADDPRWPESGAPTVDDYAFWCGRWCGMACLQMALTHRDGKSPTLYELLDAGLPYGTYVPQPDGTVQGLFYDAFIAYVRAERDLDGEVHRHLDLAQLRKVLSGPDTLVIASVHREIRRPDRPSPGQGGHLVLVTGHDPATDTLAFHNPSGHTDAARTATLDAPTFGAFYAGRAVSLDVSPGRQ
jgi:hypothetical protein